jgi:hypothetical protein
MKRYPIFDPPEYLHWTADPSIVETYENTIHRNKERSEIVSQLKPDQLLGLYAGMLRFRLHDITLRRWVRQGILSKAWLGTGEEAVTIGNVHALDRQTDKVGPMIRNAGANTSLQTTRRARERTFISGAWNMGSLRRRARSERLRLSLPASLSHSRSEVRQAWH